MTEENKVTSPSKEQQQTPEQAQNNENKKQKAKGLIRWSGIAATSLLVAGIGGGAYLFADDLAKYALVAGLESSIGAETNVEKVEVSWTPFGLSITALQQTDPALPSHNLFQLKQAKLQINLGELLLGRYVVSDLTGEGLRFSAKRAKAGVVFEPKPEPATVSTDKEAVSAEPETGIEIPSAKELLAKADLQTEKKAKALEQVWERESELVEAAIAKLPNESSLKLYEQDWRAIRKTKIKSLKDIDELKGRLDKLKSDVEQDRKALKAAKRQVKQSKAKVELAYKELKAAPKQDWQTIKSQLPIDDPNAIAIAQVLFGKEIAGYLATGQEYYEKAKPYIAAYKDVKAEDKIKVEDESTSVGRDISFDLTKPYPSWLVESLRLSLTTPKGKETYLVEGQGLTHQTYIQNTPGKYQISLARLSSRRFDLNGQFTIDQQGIGRTAGEWQLSGFQLDPKSLSDSKNLKVDMTQALVEGRGEYRFDKQWQSQTKLDFFDTRFTGQSDSEIADLTLNTLSSITDFDLNLTLAGDLSSPNMKLKSNLDNKLNTAFKQAVKKRWQQVETDTKAALADKLKDSLNLNDGQLAKLQGFDLSLDNIESQLKKISSKELDNLVSNKKDKFEQELQAKAQAELKKQEEKAKAELKAKEEKAKQALKKEEEKLKDKLEDKLKDKLKDFKCCE